MNLPFYIARRYLFSKKSHNVINIISGISMAGVGVGSLALIVVLSAFNGLEELVESLYSSFDPDIEITAREGKTFDINFFPEKQVREMKGVQHYTNVLEENVLLRYKDRQNIATMKGVEADFLAMSGLDSMLLDGELLLEHDSFNYAVMGWGIANKLSVNIANVFDIVQVHAARRKAKISMANPQAAFRQKNIMPAGIFAINQDFDDKYFLVPFRFAREVLEYNTEVTGVELGLRPGADAWKIKQQLQALVGDEYEVKTHYEQNELIFKTNRTEKWITYLILSFILVIATFNVIGSLTMLIIDKKEDIRILKSMGADRRAVRQVFLIEGMLISGVGGLSGLALGALLCWAQQALGLVRLEGTVVEYYPVLMQPLDFLAVLGTVLLIGLLTSWLPVRYVTRKHF